MFTAFYGMSFNPFSKEIDVKYQFKSNDFVQSTSRHIDLWVLKVG
jgi:general secretion pathway protein A